MECPLPSQPEEGWTLMHIVPSLGTGSQAPHPPLSPPPPHSYDQRPQPGEKVPNDTRDLQNIHAREKLHQAPTVGRLLPSQPEEGM